MNKLFISDKTKVMILVLSFFIILILIFGIIFSKLKIKSKHFNFKLFKKEIKKTDYDFTIGFYFLGFIKLIELEISNGDVKFLFFKISLEKILANKFYFSKVKPNLEKISKKEVFRNLKNMNFKLEKIDFNLEIGTDNVVLTSVLVGILSAIVSSSMQIYIEKFEKEKYKWKIKPNFNENLFIDCNANFCLSYSPVLNKIVKNV